MAERLILVGRVAGAFGVKGEIRITPFTAEPDAMVAWGELLAADGSTALTLTGGRVAGDGLIVRARQVDTREAAQALRGLELFIPRSLLPAPDEDEFYLADLVGLRALSPEGAPLGTVKSVQNFGAGDLLEIAGLPGQASWWAPFTREAVPDVRLEEGVVIVVAPADIAGDVSPR
jgi:16S rRNA processing protein RimM